MTVKVNCPSCGQGLQIKERLIGQSIRCPACQTGFVANPAGAAATAPAGAPSPSNPSAPQPAPSTPAATQGVPGRIGRFQIQSVLGQGGFGTVYKAHDPVLDRDVALKTPRPGTQGVLQLIQESKAAARLRHPHIVAVFEAGAAGDDLYIASEYVPGTTLSERLQAETVEPVVAVAWVRSLAEALAYAHQEGVIHRDVKPHNVMIGPGNRPQLLDFGLAHIEQSGSGDNGAAGTAAYRSPEQARGEANVGPASDQYSLGVVLFEALTGKTPAAAGTTAPRSIDKGISRDLDAVCQKALAEDPGQRYTDCLAFAHDLGRWLDGDLVLARRHSVLERLAHFRKRNPGLATSMTAIAATLLMLSIASVAYGYRARLQPQIAKSEPGATTLPVTAVAEKAAPAEKPEVSRTTDHRDAEMLLYGRLLDRTRFAFRQEDVVEADRWLEQTRWDYRNWEYAYLRRLVTGGWRTIHGHAGQVTAVAVHPDSQRFASATNNGDVRVWDIASGDLLQTFVQPLPVTSLAYSPDGKILAYSTGIQAGEPSRNMGAPPVMMPAPVEAAPPPPPAAAAIEATSVELAACTQPPAPAPPATVRAAAVPIAYTVTLRDADTGAELGVFREHSGPIAALAFSPDGKLIASAGGLSGPNGNGQPGIPQPAIVAPPGAPAANDAPAAEPPAAPPVPKVMLWDPQTLQTKRELKSPMGPARRVVFSRDGQRVLATIGAYVGGPVLVWNVSNQAEKPAAAVAGPSPVPVPVPGSPANPSAPAPVVTPGDPDLPVQQFAGVHQALATSADGSLLTAAPALDLWLLEKGRRRVAGVGGSVQRWPLSFPGSGEEIREAPGSVLALAYVPEQGDFGANTLAVAGGDVLLPTRPGKIQLRDPVYEYGGNVLYLGHTTAVTAIDFRPDGKLFVSGSVDGTLKIWSAEVHPEVVRLGPQRTATRVAFGRDGRYVAVAEKSLTWTQIRGAGTSFAFAPGGPAGQTEQPPGSVTLFDIRNRKKLLSLEAGPGDVLGLAVDPDLKWLAAGGEDHHLRIWNLSSAQLQTNVRMPGVVRCIAASADGQFLAIGCGPKVVSAAPPPVMVSTEQPTRDVHVIPVSYQPPKAQPAQPPKPGQAAPAKPSPSPGHIVLWNIAAAQEVARWEAHAGDVLAAAFSPDGRQLVSSGADRAVKLWTTADHRPGKPLEQFAGEIADLAWRPNGTDIAGVGQDPCRPDRPGELIVWSTKPGKQRLAISKASGHFYGVTYSPDGRRIVTGGGSYAGSLSTPGEVTVWDAETGVELLPLAGRPGRESKLEMTTVQETQNVTKVVPVTKEVKEEIDGEVKVKTVTQYITVCELVATTRSINQHVTWEEPGTVLGVAFSGDGRSIAAACEDGSALVWDSENCQPHDTARWSNGQPFRVAASPDGKLIATGGDAGDHCGCLGLVRVYDSATGRLVRTIQTDAGSVRSLAFAPDSQKLVVVGGCGAWFPGTCGVGHEVAPLRPEVYQGFFELQKQVSTAGRGEVWDISTGKRLVDSIAHDALIVCTAVSSETGHILTAGMDQSLRLWDPETGTELRSWKKLSGAPRALAIARDSARFAVLLDNGQILTGSPDTDAPLKACSAKINGTDLAFDPTGQQLAVSETLWAVNASATAAVPSASGRITLLNLETDSVSKTFDFRFPLASMEFTADGKTLIAGTEHSHVLVIDPKTGEQRLTFSGHRSAVDVATLPDGRAVSLGMDQQLKVWRLPTALEQADRCTTCAPARQPAVELPGNPQVYVTKVRYTPDGQFVATGGHVTKQAPGQQKPEYEGVITLFDAQGGRPVDTITVANTSRPEFDLSADGRYVAISRPEGICVIWDRQEKKQIAECQGPRGQVLAVVFHPQQPWFATSHQDGSIIAWSQTGAELGKFQNPGPAHALAFDRSGKLMATGDNKRSVRLWDVEQRKELATFSGHYGEVCGLSFSGDGKRLAVTSRGFFNDRWQGDLKVWDVETGKRLMSVPSHTWWSATISYHPTLPYIASTGKDHTLQMFHAETGQLLLTIPTRGYLGDVLAFSPAGNRLAVHFAGRTRLLDPVPDQPSPFGSAPPVPARQEPGEASVARWVLEHGGQVQVIVDGVIGIDLGPSDELPVDAFVISRISLGGRDDVTDADLERLQTLTNLVSVRLDLPKLTDTGLSILGRLPQLQEIYLNGTQLTDAGLEPLGKLSSLRILHANQTRLTGSGLSHLRQCTHLQGVELHDTGLTDANLQMLANFPKLTVLGLARTMVTDAGIEKLKAALPKLNIGR